MKDFVKTNLKIILEDNPLLRNLGYNFNLTQNQNVFQPIGRNVSCNDSVNIEFCNGPIP